jgi:SnoaL-like protein
MTDWSHVHERVLEVFASGWSAPGPHAWDDFLADDVELVQPMLRDGRGPQLWWDEAARLLELMPDLTAEVLTWSAVGDTMFIDIRFTATLGGRPLTWRAVDVLRIDSAGTLLRRDSLFDPAPLVRAVLCRPRAWIPWWRSGIAPLESRRRLQRRRRTTPDPTLTKGTS